MRECSDYYTLCAMAISHGEVPGAARKHVPRYPLVSCTLIGRLAVAKDQQGQRLGSILLADALQRAFESASTVGSSMVMVDALDEAAAGFYTAHGFVRLPDSLRLVMPMRQAGRGLNDDAFAFTDDVGEAPGKQTEGGVGSGEACGFARGHSLSNGLAHLLGPAGCDRVRGVTHAKGVRAPATTCFLLLPPCFPGFPDRGGEAKNGPEGPF